MVGHARDDDIPPLDTDNSGDDSDIQSLVVQYRSLLDVKFEIGGNVTGRTFCLGQSGGVAAEVTDALADGQPAMADFL